MNIPLWSFIPILVVLFILLFLMWNWGQKEGRKDGKCQGRVELNEDLRSAAFMNRETVLKALERLAANLHQAYALNILFQKQQHDSKDEGNVEKRQRLHSRIDHAERAFWTAVDLAVELSLIDTRPKSYKALLPLTQLDDAVVRHELQTV